MITETDLLRIVDAYAEAEGVEDITISFRVFGDSKKLSALRANKDITVRRLNCAIEWFSNNWPARATWPDGIERPIPSDHRGAA